MRISRQIYWSFVALILASLASYTYNYAIHDFNINLLMSLGLSTDFIYEKLSILGLISLLSYIAALQFGITLAAHEQRMGRFLKFFMLSGLTYSIINLVVWVITTKGNIGRYNYVPFLFHSQGISQERLWLLLMLAIGLRLQPQKTILGRPLLSFIIIITSVNIATIVIRLAWLQVILSVIVFVFIARNWINPILRKRFTRLAATTILLASIFGFLKFGQIFTNLFLHSGNTSSTNFDPSVIDRFMLIMHGWKLFINHIILGIGFGHFILYSTTPIFVSGQPVYVGSAHNALIMFACETGIIGFFIIIFINRSIILLYSYLFKNNQDISSQLFNRSIFTILIVMIFSQFLTNSQILPIPSEGASVGFAITIWLFIGMSIGTMLKANQDLNPESKCTNQ